MAGAHCLRYQPPTVVPAQIANIEANVAAPEIVASATEREAFAQLQPSSQLPDAKKRELKAQRQHKIAKRRAVPAALLAARRNLAGLATAFGERLEPSYRPCETRSPFP
jgi:hypothetical protein